MFSVKGTSVEVISPGITVSFNTRTIGFENNIYRYSFRRLRFFATHWNKGIKLGVKIFCQPSVLCINRRLFHRNVCIVTKVG